MHTNCLVIKGFRREIPRETIPGSKNKFETRGIFCNWVTEQSTGFTRLSIVPLEGLRYLDLAESILPLFNPFFPFFLFAYPLLDSSTAVLTPISPRSICCFAKNCGPPGRVLGIAQEKLNYSGRCNHRDVVCRVCNLLENEWNRNGASVLFDLQDTRNPFQFFVILNTRFSSRRAKKEAVNDLAA